jgi:hypothetical protein
MALGVVSLASKAYGDFRSVQPAYRQPLALPVEEQRAGAGSGRFDAGEEAGIVGDLAVRQVQAAEQGGQVAVAQQADPLRDLDQEIAFVVESRAANFEVFVAGVRFEAAFCCEAQYPRRVLEFDKHSLRTILHEVPAVLVMRVLPVQKLVQAVVGDRLAAQTPLPAPVER